VSAKTESGRTRLPFISAGAFVSPTDRAALSSLQKTPLLPLLVRKFNARSAVRPCHSPSGIFGGYGTFGSPLPYIRQ
jgi:hypothetical protein